MRLKRRASEFPPLFPILGVAGDLCRHSQPHRPQSLYGSRPGLQHHFAFSGSLLCVLDEAFASAKYIVLSVTVLPALL